MRTFTTIAGAYEFFKKKSNKGREWTINDALHFGIGVTAYVYTADIPDMNLKGLNKSNSVFTHLTDEDQIKRAISFYFQTDGYLIAQ